MGPVFKIQGRLYGRVQAPCFVGFQYFAVNIFLLVLNSCRAYRFVPPGTGWYRLVPDKFFSPRKKAGEKNGHCPGGTVWARQELLPAVFGVCRFYRSQKGQGIDEAMPSRPNSAV
jgi:hypothetical protein